MTPFPLIGLVLAAVLSLDGAWQYRRQGTAEWHPAEVPGCVQLDLLREGLIPDPFIGRNEKAVQWVGEKDWQYRRVFSVSEEMASQEHLELVLEGVDTYADVYLNGTCIQHCDNMFRSWRIPVKGLVQAGDNELLVDFSSVFKVDIPKYLSAPYKLQAWPNNDQSDLWISLYARKAGYNYGWDWGPRLITAGLWKSVRLEGWSGPELRDVQVKTCSLEKGRAMMQVVLEVETDRPYEAAVSISVEGRRLYKAVRKVGEGPVVCDFTMKNPRLWWCNGLGDPALYDFQVEVDNLRKTVTTGVRTVSVDRTDGAMTVCLNGIPVFCKGADWVPADNFPTRITREKYDRLVRDAAAANMNMLRVWGGGLYESDLFYEACDRNGILVWQDMAFACGMFPSDSAYLASVAAEVRDNVRRLRNHPSLALWCGNNENEISYYAWGWNRTLTQEQQADYENGMRRLFYEVIPEAIAAEDNSRYYHPTSPSTGYKGIPYSEGDAHFWSVWKGGMVDEYLRPDHIARFMSEYGFQSYPCLETIEGFTSPGDRYVGSPVMLAHQKAWDDETRDPDYGDRQIRKYMSAYYRVPEDFDEFVYLSQFQQAEAVKVAMEAHRRAKPSCIGTLFWQLNDCWPVSSWSSIDGDGRWKALQYYARRAYAPVLVSPYSDRGTVRVRIVSDRPEPVRADFLAEVMLPDGTVLERQEAAVTVGAGAAEDIWSHEALPEGAFLYVELREKGRLLSDNVWFPDVMSSLAPPEGRPRFETVEGGLRISSDALVRGLHLSGIAEDDWLTIVPGHPRTVAWSGDPDQLTYKTLNDIMR